MKQKIFSFILFSVAFPGYLSAQGGSYVTENHDDCFMNQFTKSEIGTGSFKPEMWYKTMGQWFGIGGEYNNSESYLDWADDMNANKQAFREAQFKFDCDQYGYGKTVRDTLNSRIKIELLNYADRKVDIELEIEKKKLYEEKGFLDASIGEIRYYGGTEADVVNWQMKSAMAQEAIDLVHESYMPNSERKKSYISIYEDLREHNTVLNRLKLIWWNRRQVSKPVVNYAVRRDTAIARRCLGRWKSFWKACGTRSTVQ